VARVTDDEYNQLGSLAAIAGREMPGDILPDWLEQGTESSLRDSEDDHPPPAQAIVVAAQRSLGPSRRGTPVILTPVEGSSPAGSVARSGNSKSPWTDLDKFYQDSDNEKDGNGSTTGDGESDATDSKESSSNEESEEESDHTD
jgi:AP-3 complex subunit beta